MDLWNEYEGRSIDGLFPLERLIRPEGRSAFFTTSNAGTATVIRLIEPHFDEDEILARWSGVSDLRQPNLLTLTRFGQAMMDETSLVYVVMEPAEADLSQILCERPLTLPETRQVAASLVPALQALHARGFVHEHIQPGNVLAVGEVVKLRSDCIREAPEGVEGDALRTRDVHDLATLLLQALTQQRIQALGAALPAPFREIIPNGISGAWGLAQMAAALGATALQPPSISTTSATVPAETVLPELHRRSASAAGSPKAERPKADAGTPAVAATPHRYPEAAAGRVRVPVHEQTGPSARLVLAALAVLVLVAFGAYAFLHRHPGDRAPIAGQSPTPPSGSTTATIPTPDTAPVAAISPPQPRASIRDSARDSARDSWRVVAYTYNRQDQAAAKVRSLHSRYASLHPAVLSPTGHAPFLVTLGGPLGRDAAFTLRDRLRRSGLPRDLYAQNYAASSR